jgi:GNAT superfamily N-acetyltransferase
VSATVHLLDAVVDGQRTSHLALMVDHALVGYCAVRWDEERTVISDLFVDEVYRGRGYGSVLFRQAMWMARGSSKRVVLWVRSDNPIRSWYERLGWAHYATGSDGLVWYQLSGTGETPEVAHG